MIANQNNHRISSYHAIAGIAFVCAIAVAGLMSENKAYIFSDNENSCGIYCVMAQNYDNFLAQQAFDKYYFQKSVGSLFIHLLFKVTGSNPDAMSVNYALEGFSAVALVLTCLVWIALARSLNFSTSQFWVGVCGLFVNQTFWRDVPFAQESPDTLALLIGITFFYAYKKGSVGGQYALFVVALFAQPQCALILVPMIVVTSCPDVTALESDKQFDIRTRLTAAFKAVLRTLSVNAGLGWSIIFMAYAIIYVLAGYVAPFIRPPYHGTGNTLTMLMPVSIILAAFVLSVALWKLNIYGALVDFTVSLTKRTFLKRFSIVVLLLAAKSAVVAYFGQGEVASPTSSFLGSAWVFYSFQYHAIEQPLKSWIAHCVFYGPIFLLILSRWGRMAHVCRELGFGSGAILSLSLVVVLSTDAESRHLLSFMPWAMVFAIAAGKEFGKAYLTTFIVLSILSTRFFIEHGPVIAAGDPGILMWGPWWTVSGYWKAVVLASMAGALLWIATLVDKRLLPVGGARL